MVFPYRELEGPKQRINELAQEYWKAIGIEVTLKQVSSKLFWEMVNANEVDLGGKHLDMNTVTGLYSCTFCRFRPSWGVSNGRPWQTWYNTDGAEGEEPAARRQGAVRALRPVADHAAQHRRVAGARQGADEEEP